MALRPGRRLRLRARLTLAFGLGGIVLSTLVSAVTYGLVRENLVDRRQQEAEAAFGPSVARINAFVTSDEADVETAEDLLQRLRSGGRRYLLRFDEDWIATDELNFSADSINTQLQAVVANPASPQAALMRYEVDGRPFLVLGSPVGDVDALYFEATALEDIADTLDSLGLTLTLASVLTTLAAVGLGYWASRRVLLPLTDVSEAAHAIAVGDLDTRLDVESDADLEPLATTFNEMASSLQDKIERDGRFASDVSHELRSPLMTIASAVDVLNGYEDELPERAQTALGLLSQDIDRFRQLVEDLLQISRFDVGKEALDLQEFLVADFITNTMRQAGYGSVPVNLHGFEDLVVEADKRRLARVLTNLLENATNYGGGPTGIDVSTFGTDLLVAVEDAGPGVPVAERTVIFDRFARGSEGGRRGSGTGTGLGLALVREHLRLHGGDVFVTDRSDGASGARFVISLRGAVR